MFHVEPDHLPPLHGWRSYRTVGNPAVMNTPVLSPVTASPAPVWPALALMVVATGFRVLLAWLTVHGGAAGTPAWLLNFTPVAALALWGGLTMPGRLGVAVPIGILLVSDVLVSGIYGESPGVMVMLARYGSLLALCALGAGLRGKFVGAGTGPWLGTMMLASVLGSTLFYALTNTTTWLASPDYAQGFAGWAQALTTGLPGYPPTWLFFRNALVSDGLVSMLMAAATLPSRRLTRTAVSPEALA